MQKLKKVKNKCEASGGEDEYEGSYYFDYDEVRYHQAADQTPTQAKSSNKKQKKASQSGVDMSYASSTSSSHNSMVAFSPTYIQPGAGMTYQMQPMEQQQTASGCDLYETPQNERTRLVSINEAFEILRVNIPTFPYERRLSKIDTLHLTISYINLLECVLESNMSLNDYLRAYIDYKSCQPNQQTMIKPLWDSSGTEI
jgi:hypothetical protein